MCRVLSRGVQVRRPGGGWGCRRGLGDSRDEGWALRVNATGVGGVPWATRWIRDRAKGLVFGHVLLATCVDWCRRCRGEMVAKRAFFVGVLVVAVSILGACGSGSGVEPMVTVTPTPVPGSPTASPSSSPAPGTPASAPVMPDKARENTPEGAEAFTAHWFNAMNWAYVAGDTESLRLLSESECAFCAEIYEGLESERSVGAIQEGGLVSVRNIKYLDDMAPGQPRLELMYQEDSARVILPDGSVKREWVGVAPTRREAVLLWTDEHGWLLRGFGEAVRCVDCA